jgi:hypothetical protein
MLENITHCVRYYAMIDHDITVTLMACDRHFTRFHMVVSDITTAQDSILGAVRRYATDRNVPVNHIAVVIRMSIEAKL